MTPLEESYLFCDRIARRRAKNFYHSFRLLPAHKRRAMCAVYAFMRECDDISDEPREGGPAASRQALEEWRRDLASALDGGAPGSLLWPAFTDAVRRFNIPGRLFHEMIDGVSSDLEPRDIRSFDELYRYCYLVASVAGLATIHVFGFTNPAAPELAEKCGVAFQLTNIIRDVKEDALAGRVYLPREDMDRFGVREGDLRSTTLSPALRDLLSFETRRAEQYFAASRPLVGMVDKDSRGALWALIEVYFRLLGKIKAHRFEVLSKRISLPAWQKAAIALRAAAGFTFH
ncbi:MAG: phytoene/squalene synthase family protein [Bryobacteraceae bacterium]|nr:phytoene/squalene synthase family protein [Bryobacteraceae bacterium]